MRKITIDPKYTKTYKTIKNLEKALDKLNLPETLTYLQCETKGRHTAVFTNTCVNGHGGYVGYIIHKGFMVVG